MWGCEENEGIREDVGCGDTLASSNINIYEVIVWTVTANIKGTGHFFETLSVGSVPGADHS